MWWERGDGVGARAHTHANIHTRDVVACERSPSPTPPTPLSYCCRPFCFCLTLCTPRVLSSLDLSPSLSRSLSLSKHCTEIRRTKRGQHTILWQGLGKQVNAIAKKIHIPFAQFVFLTCALCTDTLSFLFKKSLYFPYTFTRTSQPLLLPLSLDILSDKIQNSLPGGKALIRFALALSMRIYLCADGAKV